MASRDIWDDLCELRIASSIWICIAKFFYWIKLPLWKKCILEFGVLISTNRISINVTDYIKSLDSAYYYSILLWHSVCTDREIFINEFSLCNLFTCQRDCAISQKSLIYLHTILGEGIVSHDGLPRGVPPSGILTIEKYCPGFKVRFPRVNL